MLIVLSSPLNAGDSLSWGALCFQGVHVCSLGHSCDSTVSLYALQFYTSANQQFYFRYMIREFIVSLIGELNVVMGF